MLSREFLVNTRKFKKISQTYAAEFIGISRSSYIRKETGDAEFNETELSRIAELFNMAPSKLLADQFENDLDFDIIDDTTCFTLATLQGFAKQASPSVKVTDGEGHRLTGLSLEADELILLFS